MNAGTPPLTAALYARWCDATWANAPWTAHDDAPPEAEPDDGPLDFGAGEPTEICFDSQAHWLQSCLARLVAPDLWRWMDRTGQPDARGGPGVPEAAFAKFVPGGEGAGGRRGRGAVDDRGARGGDGGRGRPSRGAAAAPVQCGPVSMTRLRGDGMCVRIAADDNAIDLSFGVRARRDRDGQALTDPYNCTLVAPGLELAALQQLGLARGEATVLRATWPVGPGQLDTSGPELVALGLGFAGRGGGLAALIAAMKEDAGARPVYERLLAPSGLDVEFASYERIEPVSGGTVVREDFELVSTTDGVVSAAIGRGRSCGRSPIGSGRSRSRPRIRRCSGCRCRCGARPCASGLLRGARWIGRAARSARMVRTEVGVATALLLARRGFMALRAWLIEQLDALARRFPEVALRDPAAWAEAPALEAALVEAARVRLSEAERGRLVGLRGHVAARAPVRTEAVGSAKSPPPGGGHVEKRVKVSAYGTLRADSSLLVPVPAASPGAKRLHTAAAAALARMSEAVVRDLGLTLKIASAWRAHRWTSRAQYEAVLVQRFGSIAEGKRWLGFDSPHETGLAIDIGVGGLWPSRSTADAQRRQPLHQWLVARAWEFGWYPYKVEPWHWEFPLSLKAFKTGVVGPDDPPPPEGALTFSDDEDDEDALEDTDLGEQPGQ
jgi:hypothetical protein